MSYDTITMYDEYRKEWYGSIRLSLNGEWLTLSPHNIEIVLPITDEAFSANIRWYDNGEIGNTLLPDTLYLGETLEVWANTLPVSSPETMHLLFSGRVFDIGEEYNGDTKLKAEKFITAYGYARDLMSNYRLKKTHADTALNLFNEIGQELIDNTIIAGTVFNYTHNSWVKGGKEGDNYFDLLQGIAQDADWDFYVDNGKTLRAFSRGANTFSTVLIPDFQSTWKWDMEEMLNTIQVWGASTCYVGSDQEYSETIGGWTGHTLVTIDASHSCSSIVVGTTSVGELSTYSVHAYATDNTIWLTKAFSPALNLSYGGRIHLFQRFEARWLFTQQYYGWSGLPGGEYLNAYQLYFKAHTDNTNYYSKTVSVTGGRYFLDKGFMFAWSELLIGFNQYDMQGWNRTGKPQWNDIGSIRIGILHPMSTMMDFYIDDLYFSDMQVIGAYGDQESMNNYGVRTRKPMKDQDIPTKEVADTIAFRLIQAYGRPRISATDVDVDPDKLWSMTGVGPYSLPLGYRTSLAVGGKTIPAELRQLSYNFDGKMVTAKADLANCYIPKIERVFSIITNLLDELDWDIDAFNAICTDQAIVDTNSDILQWDRVSEQFGLDAEMAYQRQSLFQTAGNWTNNNWSETSIAVDKCSLGYDVGELKGAILQSNDDTWKLQASTYFKIRASYYSAGSPTESNATLGLGGFGYGYFYYQAGVPDIYLCNTFAGILYQTVNPSSTTQVGVLGVVRYDNGVSTIASTVNLGTYDTNKYYVYELHTSYDEISEANHFLWEINNVVKGTINYLGTFDQNTYVRPFLIYHMTSSGGGTLNMQFKGGVIASPWEY